jgi:ABC-type glycerol-3-phosphate transport system permease component
MNLRYRVPQLLLYAIGIVVGLLYVFPFFWMLVSSFKFNEEVLKVPIQFFPSDWTTQGYLEVFTHPSYDFLRYLFNSVVVTVFAVLLTVILSATAGYGFAKYRFRGRSLLFIIVLATIMMPLQTIVVPLFVLIRQLGLENTYMGLIIPEALTAFGVFLMRQFCYSIPDEMIECARIDGAGELQIFARISMPVVKTGILALVIFHSQWVWNLLIWPLVVISKPLMRTLPQGIALLSGVYFTPYPQQLAISVVACLPILVLYLFLSRYFVAGITLGAVKG